MKNRIVKFAAVVWCLAAFGEFLACAAVRAQPAGGPAATSRRPLSIEGREGLYQRIIVRPGSALFEQPQQGAASHPIPGFSVYYVYGRQPDNKWVEVGSTPIMKRRSSGNCITAERSCSACCSSLRI